MNNNNVTANLLTMFDLSEADVKAIESAKEVTACLDTVNHEQIAYSAWNCAWIPPEETSIITTK